MIISRQHEVHFQTPLADIEQDTNDCVTMNFNWPGGASYIDVPVCHNVLFINHLIMGGRLKPNQMVPNVGTLRPFLKRNTR